MKVEIIPCTQATFLISKREESALTLREGFQLLIHLAICEFCRRFLKQMRLIERTVRKLVSTEHLTDDEKRQMESLLRSP